MKIRFKDYQIGLLTNLFDVSADTIRLYSKKGILADKKNENNKYRIFHRDDIFNMAYIMQLRQMDIPLDYVQEIVCSSTLDDIQGMMSERLECIDEEIAKLIAVRENLCSYSVLLDNVIRKANKIEVADRKMTFLMMDIRKSIPQTIEYLKSLDRDLQPLLTLYTPGNKATLETNQDFLDKKRREEANFVLTCEDVNGISREKGFPSDRISIIGPSRFVTSIGYTYTNVKYEFIDIINRYIKENGLQRHGNYFSQYLMSQNIHGGAVDYYRTWIPIK